MTLAMEQVTPDSELQALRKLMWALLVLGGLLACLPILLAPHDMWDGIPLHYSLTTPGQLGLREFLLDGNFHITYALTVMVGWLTQLSGLSPVTLFHYVEVAGLCLAAYEVFRMAREWFEFEPCWAILASAFFLVFPASSMLFSTVGLIILYVWLALLGHRLLLKPDALSNTAGLALVVLSFQLNSNFVFVLALHALAWTQPVLRQNCTLVKVFVLAAVTVACYAAIRIWLPTHGIHTADYNHLLLPTSVTAVVRQLKVLAAFMTWGLFPLLTIVLIAAYEKTSTKDRHTPLRLGGSQNFVADAKTVSTLLGMCLASVFAYIAVGKGAPLLVMADADSSAVVARAIVDFGTWPIRDTLFDWKTRYVVLLAIPLSIASVWMLRRTWKRKEGEGGRGFFVLVLAAWLVPALWLFTAITEKYQRFADEIAIIDVLRLHPPPTGLVDIEILPVRPYLLRDFEANYLLWLATGRVMWATTAYSPGTEWERVTKANRQEVLDEFAKWTKGQLATRLMTDYRPNGCHTKLVITLPASELHRIGSLILGKPKELPAAKLQKQEHRCS